MIGQEAAAGRELEELEPLERRLVRLGYDLHDGPLQDIVALAADVRLFRRQLAGLVGPDQQPLVLGRFDDLEAQLASLDAELRELARNLEPRSALEKPFPDALADEVDSFAARSDVDAVLELDGRFEGLTPSQRIALLRVAGEALANVREHSGAGRVRVSVVESVDGVRLEVEDDGRGFDVTRALQKAEEGGRLGLAGMSERIQLLGGAFSLESRPGGPTTVAVELAPWSG